MHRLAAHRMATDRLARLMTGLCLELQSLALLAGVLLLTFAFLSIFLFCMHFQMSLTLIASRKTATADLTRERFLSCVRPKRVSNE